MKRLGVSLVLLVLLSLIALGWLGDRLFGTQPAPQDHSVQVASEFLSLLAAELENHNSTMLERLRNSGLSTENGYSLSWMQRKELRLPASLEEQLTTQGSLILQTDNQITLYRMVQSGTALLAVSLPLSEPALISVKLGLTLLFYTLLAGVLMLWLYPLMVRISRLTRVAQAVGAGDFSQTLETSASSQLHTIETEFNRMSQRIQALLEDNKLLSGAVSHDLRTPLARLRFGVDALQEQKLNSQSSNYLERISRDLDSMEQLVGVLLEFVKLDKQLDDLPLGKVSLETISRECVDAANSHKGIAINMTIEQDLPLVIGDDRFTRMIFNNLLGNALKHARSEVLVSINRHESLLWLLVEDDGPGFGNNDKRKMLRPFERGEASRDLPPGKNYGLGLAIVKRIIDWYDARLLLQDSDTLGGARICVGFRQAD